MRTRLVLLVSVLLCATASAQPEIGLDVGVVAPVGELGANRSLGTSATLSANFGTESKGLGWRVEASWQRIFGPAPPPNRSSQLYDDYSAYSLRGNAIYTFGEGSSTAYGVVGAGAYHLAVVDDTNPYGPVAGGVNLGIGTRFPIGAAHLVLEAQAVALLTDYGAGAFNFPVVYVPLTAGVRF